MLYACAQRDKANTSTSDKETSFLDLNIKVIGNIHTSVYDKRNDFGFPLLTFPGRVVILLGSHHMLLTFCS